MIVRTVTAFMPVRASEAVQPLHITAADAVHKRAVSCLKAAGYDVQTVRLVTDVGEAGHLPQADVAQEFAKSLRAAVPADTLLSVGALRTPEEVGLAPIFAAAGITSCALVSCDTTTAEPALAGAGVGAPNSHVERKDEGAGIGHLPAGADDVDGIPDAAMCFAAARAIAAIAKDDVHGNFRFAAVAPGRRQTGSRFSHAPFFPAAHVAHVAQPASAAKAPRVHFSVGLQFPSVIRDTLLSYLAALPVPVPSDREEEGEEGEDGGKGRGEGQAKVEGQGPCLPHEPSARVQALKGARQAVQAVLARHYGAITAACLRAARETESTFLGIDGSLAPLPSDASIMDIYRLLGVQGGLAGPGALEASAWLTKTLKEVPLFIPPVPLALKPLARDEPTPKLLGYTGLMLAPMEDAGLAADAEWRVRRSNGEEHTGPAYGMRDLLTCSSVCGVGLDTVPIPGDTPPQVLARVIGDVAAMAWRLDKPLSVRLFPCPGLKAGQRTALGQGNPHLCDTSVFAV